MHACTLISYVEGIYVTVLVDLLALGDSVWNYVTPAWEEVHGRRCMGGGAWEEVHGRGAWEEVHGRRCMGGGAWEEVHGRGAWEEVHGRRCMGGQEGN